MSLSFSPKEGQTPPLSSFSEGTTGSRRLVGGTDNNSTYAPPRFCFLGNRSQQNQAVCKTHSGHARAPLVWEQHMPHSKRTSVNLQNHLAPARSSVKRPTRQNLPVNTTAYLERSFAALFALTRSTRLSRRRLTLRTRYHHAETRQPVYMFLRSLAIISSHLFLVRQLYLRKTTAFQDGNTSNSATQPACITQAAKLQE